MGEYSIPAVSEFYYGCISSGEGRRFEKIEKFNALKASRPEVVADAEDTHGICCRRRSGSRFFFKSCQKIRKL
jgi:hypothetical protein